MTIDSSGEATRHIYSSLFFFFFFFLSPFLFIGNTFIIYIGGRHGSDILRERIGRPTSALLPLCEREISFLTVLLYI